MKKTTTLPVLMMVAALTMAGCADDAEQAVEEADPGVDATIEPPAVNEPEVVGEDDVVVDDEALLPDGVSQACYDAVAAAGDETNLEGFAADSTPLWPAFDACTSIEEFSAATESVSGVLGDEQPEEYLRELCSSVDEINGSVLCLEVGSA